jgi:GNAT superfamily N-acetyltransferase
MVEVRTAAPTDARAIAGVQVHSWQVAYRGLLPTDLLAELSVDGREQFWGEVLKAPTPGAAVLVAEEAGPPVVGFVAVRPRPDSRRIGDLMALYVAPSAWRCGIGMLLHDAAVEHLVGQGCERAELWMLDGNERAAAFYRALGWSPDGRRQVEEQPDGFVLPVLGMSRDLRGG